MQSLLSKFAVFGGAAQATDPYWNNVSFFARFNGTNNSTTMTEEKGTTLTRVGSPVISTTQFKFGGSSLSCPTFNDYLNVSTGTWQQFGTGDFTVEMWAYCTASGHNLMVEGSSTATWGLLTYTNNLIWHYNGSQFQVGTVPLNQWNHLAISRTSGIIHIYINGALVHTAAHTTDYSGNPTRTIGPAGGNANSQVYIDAVRVTKGVGRYNGNFIPSRISTFELDLLASQNQLQITCDSGTLADDTSKNTLTLNGNVARSTTQSRYGGASIAFDGTGDYISVPDATALRFGTGDFTIEGWVYRAVAGVSHTIVNKGASGGGFTWYITSANVITWYFNATLVFTSTLTIPATTWTHIRVTRNSSVIRLYINGILCNEAADSNNYLSSGVALLVGSDGSFGFNGYIDDFRLTIGTARNPINFTPATTEFPVIPETIYDPFYERVSLLTHIDNSAGTAIVDNSLANVTFTKVGNADASITQVKFGSGALALDGTGDYVTVPYSPALQFTGDFTIEFWAYKTSGGAFDVFFECGLYNNGVMLRCRGTTAVDLYVNGTGAAPIAATIALNTWVHWAVVRYGAITQVYMNGVAISGASVNNATTTNTGSNILIIGDAAGGNTDPMAGYIDDFRITKGIARYINNFTPPTNAFPNNGL